MINYRICLSLESVHVYANLLVSLQGIVNFGEDFEATVHYSIPKDSFGGDKNIMKNDWCCYKVSFPSIYFVFYKSGSKLFSYCEPLLIKRNFCKSLISYFKLKFNI